VRGLFSALATVVAFGGLAGALILSRIAPDVALWLVLGALVGVPLLWILGCALIPGMEDRRCDVCHSEALVPMDLEARYGVRCTECGHEDPDVPTARLGHEPPAR
jgi:hypothetical protein